MSCGVPVAYHYIEGVFTMKKRVVWIWDEIMLFFLGGGVASCIALRCSSLCSIGSLRYDDLHIMMEICTTIQLGSTAQTPGWESGWLELQAKMNGALSVTHT